MYVGLGLHATESGVRTDRKKDTDKDRKKDELERRTELQIEGKRDT